MPIATFLGDNGIEYKKILSVLNHSDKSVTAIYNRSLDFKNKLQTLTFWNNSIKMGINENNKIHKRLVK